MTDTASVLIPALLATFCGGAGLLFQLLERAPLDRPSLGFRGLKRSQALNDHRLFALAEPLIRRVGAWLPVRGLHSIRSTLERWLRESGDYLGLDERELRAASVLLGFTMTTTAALLTTLFGITPLSIPISLGVGVFLPLGRVRLVAHSRARQITRALPSAIELASMCMGAGLDFPRSLRLIVECSPDDDEPIVEELSRVLQELDFGRTRREALLAFRERVATDEVRELVNSVVQSEEKGTPIARVLTIQARTLRLRRSAAAEEAASGAALMLVGPMTLIFACVIALLMGPVVLRVIGGGLG